MKRRIVIFALATVATLSVTRSASAQTSTAQPKVGFGVGIEPLNLGNVLVASALGGNVPPSSFYVPIDLLPNLRIEPSFGYWHYGADKSTAGIAGNPDTYSVSMTSIGVGGFFYFSRPAPVGLYAGARLTLLFNSASTMLDQGPPQIVRDQSETDVLLAPALGGEYAFAPRFSVGAEVQLPITFYGNPSSTRTGQPTITQNINRTGFSSNTVVFLRYFFL